VEVPAPQPAAEPSPATETKLAALDAAPPPVVENTPVPFEQIEAPALTDASERATQIAALGSPAAQVETPAEAKKASEKAERAEIRRQQRAERARERRRLAARRARLAAQHAATQQAVDPFSQVVQQMPPAVSAAAIPTATTRRR